MLVESGNVCASKLMFDKRRIRLEFDDTSPRDSNQYKLIHRGIRASDHVTHESGKSQGMSWRSLSVTGLQSQGWTLDVAKLRNVLRRKARLGRVCLSNDCLTLSTLSLSMHIIHHILVCNYLAMMLSD
jgi:hypothetical protein